MTAEDRAWLEIAPVGREFGSPDYERLTRLDAQADEAEAAANRPAFTKEIHPGEILLKEFIEPRNLTPEQLAADLDWPPSRMAALLQGIQPISAEIALSLGLFFNMEAKFWLNLQANYDKRMRSKELRGSVLRYGNPTDPIGLEDWKENK